MQANQTQKNQSFQADTKSQRRPSIEDFREPNRNGGCIIDGYRIVTGPDGRRRGEHRLVWEAHHGAIPPRYAVHHLNHIRDDNRIENLCLLSDSEHASLHSLQSWVPNRERAKQRREQLIRLGICPYCAEEESPARGGVVGISCYLRQRAKYLAGPKRRSVPGVCPDCSGPSAWRTMRCADCFAAHCKRQDNERCPRPPIHPLPRRVRMGTDGPSPAGSRF